MRSKAWLCALATAALLAGTATRVLAQDHDHGRGDQSWHEDHGHHGDWGRADEHGRYYRAHDQDAIRGWYRAHYNHLPPGLARRDALPPGLERQLVVRGILPVELRRRIEPCPPDLVRTLPPPPPHCEHVFIGGHLVLLDRANFQVVDVFHFEL